MGDADCLLTGIEFSNDLQVFSWLKGKRFNISEQRNQWVSIICFMGDRSGAPVDTEN